MNKLNRLAILLGVSIISIGLDQFTKAIAQSQLHYRERHSFLADTVRLELAHNEGAFLGMGSSLSPEWRFAIWTLGVGAVLAGMLVYALIARQMDRLTLISLTLIVAGGASNLYDRIVYGGYVIDFLNVGVGGLRTGIFNVADMGIMAGAFVMLWTAFRGSKPNSTAA